MTENVCPNRINTVERKRKPRFSLPANDRTVQQLGRIPSSSFLLQTSSETSGMNSPGNSSSDGEWAKFQAALNESKEQSKMLEESDSDISFDDGDDDDVARVLTFESSPVKSPLKKRMSIGTINNERNEIALMKRDIELDEEIADLNAQQDAMEDAFRWMFSEITQQRIRAEMAAKGKKTKNVNVNERIASLDLENVDHIEWATLLEQTIEKYMI